MRFQFGGHHEKPERSEDRQRSMSKPSDASTDALVFFGATGDLAYKKIFPALQAMVKRGHLNVPVIGVAKVGLDAASSSTSGRATASRSTVDSIPRRSAKLTGLLRYVDGDYGDRRHLRQACAANSATPGGRRTTWRFRRRCSARWSSSCAQAGCTRGARVIVEKPFGRDLASALALNQILLGTFDEHHIFRIDHYLGKAPGAQHAVLSLRATRCSSRSGTATTCESVQITMAENFGVQGRGGFYDDVGTIRDVIQNHLFQVLVQPGDGAAGAHRQRVDPRREGQGAEGDPPA